ncbi:MAG: hypothetical protein Q9169_006739 [Polycauliona sp. 2 TL-2023]
MVAAKHVLLLAIASLAAGRVVKRADPPFQKVPKTAKADNTFHVPAQGLKQIGMPPDGEVTQNPMYGARSIDLPFSRLQHGKMKFFPKGELNAPDSITDIWAPGKHDSAEQSACGIPDSAYQLSKVAIHPYWLKFAPLERWCMSDVCISFWSEDDANGKSSDMMLKVTDICSTDPNDPTACLTPYDIKIDRSKAQIMQKLNLGGQKVENQPELSGHEFTEGKSWWFFMKCWADGTVQPAYQSDDNWFSTPKLESNINWAQKEQTDQWKNNQVSYKEKGWPLYPNGAFRIGADRAANAPPLDGWEDEPVPEWCPVAGGKGFGIPTGKDCSSLPNTGIPIGNNTAPDGARGRNSTYSQGSGIDPHTPEAQTSGNQDVEDDIPSSSSTGGTSSGSTANDGPAPASAADTSSETSDTTSSEDPEGSGSITPSDTTASETPESSGSATAAAVEEEEEDDGTCAADEVEEPDDQTEADDEDTCAADEVWVADEL